MSRNTSPRPKNSSVIHYQMCLRHTVEPPVSVHPECQSLVVATLSLPESVIETFKVVLTVACVDKIMV